MNLFTEIQEKRYKDFYNKFYAKQLKEKEDRKRGLKESDTIISIKTGKVERVIDVINKYRN